MKRKILGTMLAVIFIIPCLLLLVACSEQPDRLIPVDDDDIAYIEIFNPATFERRNIINRDAIERFCETYGEIKMTLHPGKTNVEDKVKISTLSIIYVYVGESKEVKYTIELKYETKADGANEFFFFRTANVEGNVTNNFNYLSYAATENTLADMLTYTNNAA